jgi:hypothetical protein
MNMKKGLQCNPFQMSPSLGVLDLGAALLADLLGDPVNLGFVEKLHGLAAAYRASAPGMILFLADSCTSMCF